MKRTFYSILVLVFTCVIPLHAMAEEAMPSWEGIYCDQAKDVCMRIYDQGVDTITGQGSYAQILFFTEKSNAFLGEAELSIASPTEANVYIVHLTPSADRKSITVAQTPYFSSWGDDDINQYGDALLFGTYAKMP